MANGEYDEKINRYAVRIAVGSEDNLAGSGVLFLRRPGESPLLLTAAHVVCPFIKGAEAVTLCLGCMDGNRNVQRMELRAYLIKERRMGSGKEGEIYIHPRYRETEEPKQEYNYDAAIAVLPWEEWMETLDSFLIGSEVTATEALRGWGFPGSMDNETKAASADVLAGKKGIRGEVDNKAEASRKFSFSYDGGTWERTVTRESYMKGFSGCGLFCIQEKKVALKGIISCECGGRAAGAMLWASSAGLFLELMAHYKLEIGCPQSFQCYMDMVAERFYNTRKAAKMLFIEWSEELMEEGGLLPEDFLPDTEIDLPCAGNRRFCDDFWIGQLKKAALLYGIQKVPAEELARPVLQMPEPYGKDKVRIVFLCTEESAESIIGELIEKDYFAEEGEIKDGTVFVLNGRKPTRVMIPRHECREVVCNITADYSSRSLKKKTFCLLPEEGEDGDFDIIKGKVSQCNLAAIGIDEMMAVLDRNRIKKENLKKEMEDILIKVWEE